MIYYYTIVKSTIAKFTTPGKQRSKKEASMNTNKHNPGGHERKIVTKLMNAEKNNLNRDSPMASTK